MTGPTRHRLLLDQNLSPSLVVRLRDVFPELLHARDVGLASAPDGDVWQWARDNKAVIVTKDDDFRQRAFLLGAPPKVIWVRLGNCTTRAVEMLLRRRRGAIEQFLGDADSVVMVLRVGAEG